ncbi:glycosyltransferase family 4 protein [Kineococcus sp. R86509]|uniref:glycosyltransferase family 4 protein n=1 Tax=Kineococcus sp. R86509 TaxID=3093851 RepID=UPI0036D2C77D
MRTSSRHPQVHATDRHGRRRLFGGRPANDARVGAAEATGDAGLRVLHVVRRPVSMHGGVERVVAGLVREMGAARPTWSVRTSSAFRPNERVSTLPIVSDVVAALRIAGTLRRSDADVAYVHCPECLWVNALLRVVDRWRHAGRHRGPKVVAVWHGAGPRRFLALRGRRSVSARVLAAWVSRAERGALTVDSHVAVHPEVVADLRHHHGLRAPVVVIRNALDRDVARRLENLPRRTGQSLGLRVLWAGQTGYAKGLDIALAAFAHARERVPGLTLVVAGLRAPDSAAVEGVEWLGVVPPAEMAAVYAGVDLMLFPSRYESFGLVVVEAMGAGLPVVVSTGLPGDIVVDDRNGLVVQGWDPADYAAAMVRLASDPAVRARMASQNRDDVRRFDPAERAEEFARDSELVASTGPGQQR